MKNVVLARIDDRLIHGQVITAWVKAIKATAILIIDEELTKNTIMQRIYKASAPTNISLLIMTPSEAIKFLLDDDGCIQELIILVKVPQRLEELTDAGIRLDKITLGGMGANKNRIQLVRNVFASIEEIACMKRMLKNNLSIQYQLVPDDKAIDIQKLL